MTNIGQAVTKNAQELASLLDAVKTKMEVVAKLYPLLGQAEKDSVERSELLRLICLCEGSYNDEIHGITEKIKHLTKPRTEGRLIIGEGGKYRLDTGERVFSCGSSIEVYIEDPRHGSVWKFGRVEHKEDMGGYYFRSYGGDEYRLSPGMMVAIRG